MLDEEVEERRLWRTGAGRKQGGGGRNNPEVVRMFQCGFVRVNTSVE
jgi:hypothetical protein